jgi:protein-disulfide isomerase
MNIAKQLSVRAALIALVTGLILGCAAVRVPEVSGPPTNAPKVIGDSGAVEQYLGDAERYAVPVAGRPCRGSKTPLVTMVEFVDFHSPFVRRVESVVQQLLAAYAEDLQVCVRHFPVVRDNPYAVIAAEGAEEAFAIQGSDGFFRAYEFLLSRPLDSESIAQLAVVLRVRADDLDAALRDHRHFASIKADTDLADATGYTGAPNFYVQGRHLGGARPYADFQVLVQDELVRARRLIAAGLPRTEIYSRVLEHPVPRPRVRRDSKVVGPQTVWIRLINVSYGGYGLSTASRSRAEALSMIQSALDRVRGGEDFAAVARQVSEGSTAPQGGDHGALHRNSLTKQIEDAAFALEVGGISSALEGEHGFSIVQRYR